MVERHSATPRGIVVVVWGGAGRRLGWAGECGQVVQCESIVRDLQWREVKK